jgi:hypothetical protein
VQIAAHKRSQAVDFRLSADQVGPHRAGIASARRAWCRDVCSRVMRGGSRRLPRSYADPPYPRIALWRAFGHIADLIQGATLALQSTTTKERQMETGIRMMMATAALALVVGCTTVAPQADRIRTTREAAEVASCKPVGSVQSTPPYMFPGDDMKQIRNQALPLGADTILITSPRLVFTSGVAYKCG